MFSIIVVPTGSEDPGAQIRLGAGEPLTFGRDPRGCGADGQERYLTFDDPGISRSAGRISATETFWTLSNFSASHTYVVENPEGAGEYLKVVPGRLNAPVPFEFARVVLPTADRLLTLDVWAPRHDFLDPAARCVDGEQTTLAFPLDHSKRYFQVLTALCEPRLRGEPHAPLPTVTRIVERLRPVWPTVTTASVHWNIDYLAVKLRLKPGPDAAGSGSTPRLNGKKEALVSLALRFDLVREEGLRALGPDGAAGGHKGNGRAGTVGRESAR
ncbi:FHA domain-containing protein [Streptomyces sp. NPDC048172]|uniref:FHA domain-containing protein n=1 Tax=Streptomyces sp. NPDC048172 TaxID=3365505 RepID=UPI00371BB78A